MEILHNINSAGEILPSIDYDAKVNEVESLRSNEPDVAYDIIKELRLEEHFQLNIETLSKIKYTKGICAWRLNRFEEALFIADELLYLSMENKNAISQMKAYNIMGLVYTSLNNFDKALHFFNKGLDISRLVDNKQVVSMILNNIGEIYNNLCDYKLALSSFTESYNICNKINDRRGTCIALINIAEIKLKLSEYEEAKQHLDDASILSEDLNDIILFSHIHHLYGLISAELMDYDKAIVSYELALNYSESSVNHHLRIQTLQSMVNAFLKKGDLCAAENFIHEALDISKKNHYTKQISDCASQLADLYEAKGDFKKALMYSKMSIEANLYNEKSIMEQRLKNISIQHEMEQNKKEKEIYRLKHIEMKHKNKELISKNNELERLYDNMKVIANIGVDVTSTLDFGDIIHRIYENIVQLLVAQSFGIALYDPETKKIDYNLFIKEGLPLEMQTYDLFSEESLAAWCIRHQKLVHIRDFSKEHSEYVTLDEDKLASVTYRSMIFCPLMIDDQIVGAMTVQSKREDEYNQYNLDTFVALSSYVANAINNSQKSSMLKQAILEHEKIHKSLEEVNKQLVTMSYKDALTDIPNRRRLIEVIQYELGRAKRQREPLSILLMDIDKFKEFNDNYGHISGDQCLSRVASIIKQSLKRETDFIGRYGGDEFVVVLPNTNKEGALTVASNIHQNIRSAQIEHKYSTHTLVTATIGGVSDVPDPKLTVEQLIHNADESLYEAKKMGRNCSVIR